MVYKYEDRIVNHNKVEKFYDNVNFVGYILPNGNIFKCKDHNVSNACTFLNMYLMLLDKDYSKKDELLDASTDNELSKLILYHLKKMSHDEIHALLVFMNKNNYTASDLLVCYFGCHLITRLEKEILTSEINYNCFYNYLLNDFKITNVGKFVYDEEKKEFRHIMPDIRNDYLYDEIKRVKSEIKENEIELFYKR